MEEKLKGNTILFYLLMLTNFLIGLFSLSLFILGIYLWVITKSFNALSFSFFLIFLFLSGIFVLGCYLRYAPTSLLLYFIFNLILGALVLLITLFLIVDKNTMIQYLIQFIEDPNDEIENKIMGNIDSIKILFLSYVLVFV